MSITRHSYPASHSFHPKYVRTEKDASTNIIIVDDVVNSGLVDVHTEVNREVTWLKVQPGYSVVVMNEAPAMEITPFTPSHDNLGKTRLFTLNSEVFVVRYTNAAKSSQEEVTGYSLGPNDTVYIKIDRISDTVTVYHP